MATELMFDPCLGAFISALLGKQQDQLLLVCKLAIGQIAATAPEDQSANADVARVGLSVNKVVFKSGVVISRSLL